jgi:hypothetical protein
MCCRRIVEFAQGEKRAEYDAELLEKLAADLTRRFGRGFSRPNLQRFREFYLRLPLEEFRSTVSSETWCSGTAEIVQTLSAQSPRQIRQTASGELASEIRSTLSGNSESPIRIFASRGRSQGLSASDVADFLAVKLEHLPKIWMISRPAHAGEVG